MELVRRQRWLLLLCTGLSTLTAMSEARAAVIWLSQDRVFGNGESWRPGLAGEGSYGSTRFPPKYVATDFGRFATPDWMGPWEFWGGQISTIGPDSIEAQAYTHTWDNEPGIAMTWSTFEYTHTIVTFRLTEPTPYSLSVNLDGGDLKLESTAAGTVFLKSGWHFEPGRAGVLAPGDYTFNASAGGGGGYNVTLIVPEPASLTALAAGALLLLRRRLLSQIA